MAQQVRIRPRAARAARKKILITALALTGVVLALLVAGAWLLLPRPGHILSGITQKHGPSLGDLTRAEAQVRVEQALGAQLAQTITLQAAGRTHALTRAELGVHADAETVVREAYAAGRTGNLMSRLWQSLAVRQRGLAVTPVFSLRASAITETLTTFAREIDQPAVSASAHWDDASGQIVRTAGQVGGKLDRAAAEKLVRQTLMTPSASRQPLTLALPFKEVPPAVTEAQIAAVDTVLSEFTTSFTTSTSNRASNVDTAAEAIDNVVLKPGAVFSFNQIVGPRTANNGFRTAPVIIDGQLQPGMGGGVCQVSTTLYNAVLLANMDIVRRSHHSLPVHYVPPGRDATVSYGAIDFQFRNTSGAPIVIDTRVANRRLTVRILGAGPAPTVRIERSGISSLPGRTITKKDPTLPEGTRKVEHGGSGLAVTVTRVVGEGDAAVSQVISHDRYVGSPAVVRIGTGPANAANSATVATVTPP